MINANKQKEQDFFQGNLKFESHKNQVCQFINLFSDGVKAPLVFKPYSLLHDRELLFKGVGDKLLERGSNLYVNINEIEANQKLIFAELPFGLYQRSPFVFDNKMKVAKEVNLLAQVLEKISTDGFLFTLIPEGKFSVDPFLKILSKLTEKGYSYNLAVQVGKLYEPLTRMNLHLVCFQKKTSTKLFTGRLRFNSDVLYDNFLKYNNIDLEDGLFVDRKTFKGFTSLKISYALEKKLSDYTDYSISKLEEISEILDSNFKGKIQDESLILIPKHARKVQRYVADDNGLMEQKVKNHYIVKITSTDVLSEYIEYFFNTSLGQLILEEKKSFSNIRPYLSKQQLNDLKIIYPSINIQNEIIRAYKSLMKTQSYIEDLRNVINDGPDKAKQVSEEIIKINQKLGTMSLEDKIHEMIDIGENRKIEFKETFGLNLFTNNLRDEKLIKASIKNIVAFLNTQGGNLLIGVNDSGKITGLNNEIELHKSKDQFKLFFSDKVQNSLRTDMFYSYIDFQIIEINKKLILNVKCKPSNEPCFYNKNEFYVRANPKAEKLEGTNLLKYTKNRFN